jgi:glycosyltransferase involved in cell wall biosynthesis
MSDAPNARAEAAETEHRLKVLFLTNVPSPYRVKFFNELGRHCDLTVVYERNAAADRDTSWSSVSAAHFAEVYLHGVQTRADAAFCPEVLRYLLDRTFNVVVVGGYSTPTGMWAITWLRALRIPYLLNVDGGLTKKDSPPARRIKQWLISGATAWLSTGPSASRYLEHYGADPSAIHVYPFTSVAAADVAQSPATDAERARLRAELGITESRCVLAVGQFIHRKGFDLLIRAAPQLGPDVGVYIVGGTPTREYEEIRSQESAFNVHFDGFKSPRELKKYYRAADVFVLPTREDVWGLVINEAIAQGLPIVTTDRCVAGIELVADHVNGRVVTAGSVNELADGLRSILAPGVAEQMGLASLTCAEAYTLERMAERHLDIFRQVRACCD